MSIVSEIKKQFKTETAYQLALFSYVYNKQYKEDLKYLKEIWSYNSESDED